MDDPRPYHESIANAIRACTSDRQVNWICTELIQKTCIPENHEVIISTLTDVGEYFGCDVGRTIAFVRDQRRRAELKAAARKVAQQSAPAPVGGLNISADPDDHLAFLSHNLGLDLNDAEIEEAVIQLKLDSAKHAL